MKDPIQLTDVLALLEEATLAEPGTLEPTVPLLSMVGWDSMGMVMFIGLVQERHGLELSVADLRDCETPADFHEQITARTASEG